MMISKTKLKRLRTQGYCDISDEKLSQLSFGNRFAYNLCALLLFVGLLFASIPVLSGMLVVTFLGIILPNLPFDYIYNHLVAGLIKRPKLPKRPIQIKFACTLATILLIAIVYSFHNGYMLAGYINGIILLASAILVSSTDICIPSIIYNAISRYKI